MSTQSGHNKSEKTVCVEFRNLFISYPLTLNYTYLCTQIKRADRATFLGVVFDSLLSFDLHIDALCSRLNKLVYLFLNLRNSLTKQHLVTVYYGIVHSILSYNIIIWGHSIELNSVFMCQKRILRIIFGLRRLDSCQPVFKSAEILTVFSTYVYKLLTYIFDRRNSIDKQIDIVTPPDRGTTYSSHPLTI